MTDETKTCQAIMHDGRPCGRKLHDSEKCICHSPDPRKTDDIFWHQIRQVGLNREDDIHDFTGFVFPNTGAGISFVFQQPVVLNGATFLGGFPLKGSTFTKSALFENAVFVERALFDKTGFHQDAKFRAAEFQKGCSFKESNFYGEASFEEATFSGPTNFSQCRFGGNVTFEDAVFSKIVYFEKTGFESEARFDNARFTGYTDFHWAVFRGPTSFNEAKFSAEVDLSGSTFGGRVEFGKASFDEEADFREATFGILASFHRANFDGGADFSDCVFGGQAFFFASTFAQSVSLGGTVFKGRADFDKVQFEGGCDMSNCTFASEVSFVQTRFSTAASFHKCRLTPTARLTFDAVAKDGKAGAMFEAETDFRNVRMENGAEFHFRFLSLEKCRFLGSKVEQMEFIDVEWPPRKKRLGRDWFYRKAVYDELSHQKGQSWEQVADIYRGLQEYYHQRNRYQEAGGFYIAEHDINRKVNRKLPFRVSARLYRMASIYGESYLRSLFWLVILLLLSPAVFLWGGIDLSSHIDPSVGPVDIVSYGLSPWPQDCYLFTRDFWEVFNANISFITLNRSELTGRLPSAGYRALAGLEMVLVVILVSFVVLALRRWFKRKSF